MAGFQTGGNYIPQNTSTAKRKKRKNHIFVNIAVLKLSNRKKGEIMAVYEEKDIELLRSNAFHKSMVNQNNWAKENGFKCCPNCRHTTVIIKNKTQECIFCGWNEPNNQQ